MNRFSRTWNLFTESINVLGSDTQLLIFPVLSAISTLLVAAIFFVPLFQVGAFKAIATHHSTWMDWMPLFSWYYANTFVVVFCNSALVACANERLNGGHPTVGSGLVAAWSRIHRIAAWTLLSSTVGMVLRAIEERMPRGGRIIAGVLGAAWSVLTYLIIPVIVFEDRPIIDSVSRSIDLFRRTWGEQFGGGLAFGLVGVLLAMPGILLGIVAGKFWLPAGIVFAVVYFMILAAVMSAARGIFTVALYRFATTGDAPFGFSKNSLGGGQTIIDDATGKW